MHVAVVHSPGAGDEDVTGDELCDVIRQAGHSVDYRCPENDGWDADLGAGHDLVVAAGGDGTVRRVFTALVADPCLATVVALGTANNVARTLHIPVDQPLRWVADWPQAVRSKFDIPTIASARTSRPVIEGVGSGLFARLLETAEREGNDEDVGDEDVWMRFQRIVRGAPVDDWVLQVDGLDLSGPYLGVQVMNIRETGARVPIAPHADPGDGVVDVVVIRPGDRQALLRYGAQRHSDDDAELPRLEEHRARLVVFECPGGCPVAVDDLRAIEADTDIVTVDVGSGQLSVLQPDRRVQGVMGG